MSKTNITWKYKTGPFPWRRPPKPGRPKRKVKDVQFRENKPYFLIIYRDLIARKDGRLVLTKKWFDYSHSDSTLRGLQKEVKYLTTRGYDAKIVRRTVTHTDVEFFGL